MTQAEEEFQSSIDKETILARQFGMWSCSNFAEISFSTGRHMRGSYRNGRINANNLVKFKLSVEVHFWSPMV